MKILQEIVPNVGIKTTHESNHRLGRKIFIPDATSKLRKSSFQSIGPRLFNLLPIDLRNHDKSIDNFKEKLDEFLMLIPDRPWIDRGSKLHSNTLEHCLTNWKWSLM